MDRIKEIHLLDWTNFPLWKGKIKLALLILNCNHAICKHAPTLPIGEGDYKSTFYWRVKEFEVSVGALKQAMIMKRCTSVELSGEIPDTDNAKQFLASLEEWHKGWRKNHVKFISLRCKCQLDLEKRELKQSRAEHIYSSRRPRCRFCKT